MNTTSCAKFIRLLILLVLLPFSGLLAASESYIQSLTGKLKKGDSLIVIDDKFLNLPLSEWNQLRHLSINDIVSFELRQDTNLNYYYKSFTCTLNVTIKYFTSRDDQSPKEISNINLVVNYDTARGKSYRNIDHYRFKNAFKVIVVINSISSPQWQDKLPAVFRLTSQIMVERKYPFDRSKNGTLHLGEVQPPVPVQGLLAGGPGTATWQPYIDPLQIVDGKLPITWTVSEFGGAEDYDLEWTYIDDLSATGRAIQSTYGGPSGPFDIPDETFKQWMANDNSRVTVSGNSYTLNLPYTEGYILVRIRMAHYDDKTNLRSTGPWICRDENNRSTIVHFDGHQPYLNWQYTAAFAEEGKRKEVINYFDGTQRGRQTVTIDNSTTTMQGGQWKPTAVVQETIYDVMGRPAMNILPAPVKNSLLDYYPAFNRGDATTPYSYSNITIDKDNAPVGSCAISALPLHNSSGAGQYYSSSNSFLDADNLDKYFFTKYVPDANGYPFSLTEYTKDNTGRIRRQGGVGQTLQIGAGHETIYYYSKPTPRELERLFGMEVGDASHYFKNMVVDPNGQASVSYIDANGKTIATALAGGPPPNLTGLLSSDANVANTAFNETIIKPADFQVNSGSLSMQATSTFTAEVFHTTFHLYYTINPLALVTPYGDGTSQICSNCYYNVKVQVSNECGEVIASGNSAPFQGNDYTCYVNPPPVTDHVDIPIEKMGEYTVTYTLQLSEDVINDRTNYYVEHNTDVLKLQHFFNKELQDLDLSGCYSTCDACKTLGTSAQFRAKVVELLGTDFFHDVEVGGATDTVSKWIDDTYQVLKAKCLTNICVPVSPCEQKLQQLKLDVLPGGQYARYNTMELDNGDETVFEEPDINVMRFYNQDETLKNTSFVRDDGSTVTVGSLSQADFVRAYLQHPEWADLLVKYHIEYCSYQWCKDQGSPDPTKGNEVSNIFDEDIRLNYSIGADAVTQGYYNHSDPLALLKADPFFNGGYGGTYYSSMQSDLQTLTSVLKIAPKDNSTTPATDLPAKNIIQWIDWFLYCKPTSTNPTNAEVVNSWQNCSPNASCRSVSMEWQLYRNYYLQLKSKYYALAKAEHKPDCKSCFIGSDVMATAGCIPAGVLSDYEITRADENGYANFYLTYKNGSMPFAGDYIVSFTLTVGFDPPPASVRTVNVHKGDTRALIDAYQLPAPPLQWAFTGTYTVTNIVCQPTALGTCAVNAPSQNPVGDCPPQSEFQYVYENISSTPSGIDGYNDTQDNVYYEHIGGDLTRPVTFTVDVSNSVSSYTLQDGNWVHFNDASTYHVGQMTMQAGEHRVLIGVNRSQTDPIYLTDGTIVYWPYDNSSTSYSVSSGSLSCPPYNPTVPSSCPSDPLYAQYQMKVRVFNDYVDMNAYNSCNAASATTEAQMAAQAKAQVLAQAMLNLDALKVNWLNRLTAVRNEEFPNASIDLNSLVDNLYNIAATSLQIASAQDQPLNISSSLPNPLPAGFTAPNGYYSFTEVFAALVDASLIHQGFGPDLLDAPYPLDKAPYLMDMNAVRLTADVCSNVSSFYAAWQGAGSPVAFPDWLKQQLGEDYQLAPEELTGIQNRCASGCPDPYLDYALILPVAFSAPYPNGSGTQPITSFVDCARMTQLMASFTNAYPDVTEDAKPKLYHLLLTNYFNHQLGYPLSYADYQEFIGQCQTNSTALLYDQPQSPTPLNDDFSCAASLIKNTYSRAGQEYDLYITAIRRWFRNAYVSKCLSNQASANVEGRKYEYHYTLYYYDQSGNLVKTIPPEGVRLLTEDQIDRLEKLPVQDPAACPVTTSGIVTDQQTILSNLSSGLQNNTSKAMEMWLYDNSGASDRQIRVITSDNKYMYQAAVHDGKIWIELYTLSPEPANAGAIDITLTNHAYAVLPPQLTLQSWTHLFIQSPNGISDGNFDIYVDAIKLTNVQYTNIPAYPQEWEINSGSTVTLPAADLAGLKQLCLYTRTATDDEIAANYRNSCMNPAGQLALTPLQILGRFDAPGFCNSNTGRGTVITAPDKGSLAVTDALPSGQDTHILSNVTNTFTVEFWANPQTQDNFYAGDATDPIAGTQTRNYAIFPTQGGSAAGGKAGMGVAVGTNGVSVFEHADDYMPLILRWQGSIMGWTHVAIVYNNKLCSIYVNGALKASSGTQSQKTVSPSYNFGGGYYGFMPGKLDEVRIWSVARTGSQISTSYLKSLAASDNQGLVGYWPMDNTYGNVIHDISCNNINILLTATQSFVTDAPPLTETNYVDYAGRFIVPNHGLPTNYAYNSFNQVVSQKTPDAGVSTFVYDRLGRLSITQTSEQLQPTVVDATHPANRFSYTRYDQFGRVTETGEKTGANALSEFQALNNGTLQSWLNNSSTINQQVTVTAYDAVPSWKPAGVDQNPDNLRKRVTATAFLSVGSDASQNREAASYYNYDIEGNVSELIQENKALADNEKQLVTGSDGLKHIKSEYDLISGKVNKVLYQDGRWDQFYHYYQYDAENRVIAVYTSRDKDLSLNQWSLEAQYYYYLHGPLARMQLGHVGNTVQGVDYAYTLQGWLKGVNGQQLTGASDNQTDMGGDGISGSRFSAVGRDALAYSLGYFDEDYKPIGGASMPAFNSTYNGPVSSTGSGQNLFNGNIRYSTYSIANVDVPYISSSSPGNYSAYTYNYDQLNRLVVMDKHKVDGGATNWGTTDISADYGEKIIYDANGNILSYIRNGTADNGRQRDMDKLHYNYNRDANGLLTNNKLQYIIDDAAPHSTPAGDQKDLETQPVNNYRYDNIGNLVHDESEHLNIDWTAHGKIAGINRTDNNSTTNYGYDPAGNRINKTVGVDGQPSTITHYVRDVQGNVLGVYQYKMNAGALTEGAWLEHHLYGSSRLGLLSPHVVIPAGQPLANDYDASKDHTGDLGNRIYELTNHLGNVMATISDKRLAVQTGGTPPTITDYTADMVNAQDYYPFGMAMPGRSYLATGALNYRFGFNGKENDNEAKGNGGQIDYGMRVYDPRVGKFLSVDPLTSQYPALTPYQYASNSPVDGIDEDGLEWAPVKDSKGHIYAYSWAGYEFGKPRKGTVSEAEFEDGEFDYYYNTDKNAKIGYLNVISKSSQETNHGWYNDQSTKYNYTFKFTQVGVASGWDYTQVTGDMWSGEGTAVKDKSVYKSWPTWSRPIPTSRLFGVFKRGAGFNPPPMAIESDGLGPVDYLIGLEELKLGKGIRALLNGGLKFSEYKLARGGGGLVGEVEFLTPHPYYGKKFPVRIEFDHRFITQAAQRRYNLPNWLVNNWINVKKTNTLLHAERDIFRFWRLPAEIKRRLGPGGDLSYKMFGN
jgi:RHS repeat-associated protein